MGFGLRPDALQLRKLAARRSARNPLSNPVLPDLNLSKHSKSVRLSPDAFFSSYTASG